MGTSLVRNCPLGWAREVRPRFLTIAASSRVLISHTVLVKGCKKVMPPHKTVTLLFKLVMVNFELTILWRS